MADPQYGKESPVLDAVANVVELIKNSNATTFQEWQDDMKQAVKSYEDEEGSVNSLAIASGCDILRRFTTRMSDDELERSWCSMRTALAKRAQLFLEINQKAREKISEQVVPFLRDGSRVLVHGYCPTVLAAVAHATKHRNIVLYVTEARPTCAGYKFVSALQKVCGAEAEDLEITLVPDTAVASLLPETDVVLLGAEVITENGGIINTIGSFQIAALARAMHKPVYICAETVKLARIYPLDQTELPPSRNWTFNLVREAGAPEAVTLCKRSVDYTPPHLITQIFSNLGTMTPAAISDELLKLYT
eukprot:TRINITY_DN501_c2_g1_i1.p1 TRINITY_DN501_c2_g1~~TRINITY_DN501_c2_g1_i1.p1  ORF type:complete len:321 (+),score=139.22 TRINITY_DN501_c2_g1_i1:51-965(+)